MINDNPLYTQHSGYATVALKDKGRQIMEGLLLGQYKDSPNFKEYMMCFIAELDFLFEQIEKVHSGRFLETAVGRQLDVIGIILQQSRAVILPVLWFGFQGATAAEGMADEATPALGGVFKDENVGTGGITPLDDTTYRRVLLAKATVMNRDTCDIELAYYVVSILLGRVPSVFEFVDKDTIEEDNTVPERTVELRLSTADVSTREVQLILYMSKYFIPAGITFTITRN